MKSLIKKYVNQQIVLILLGAFFSVSSIQASEKYIIEIKKFKFSPNNLMVKRGDVVQFINKDIVPHTATEGISKEVPIWNSSVLKSGDKWSVKLQRVGVINYFCNFHKSMKGKISVEE